jgi:2-polyprenyl-3-methyl-5-hydroxy-6-metoxy-1,4-benzoquinol methylase
MDLVERRARNVDGAAAPRHPWEAARARIVVELIRRLPSAPRSALDVGCGDGYVASELDAEVGFKRMVAQDIHLTDGELAMASRQGSQVEFVRSLDDLGSERFELLLLLDVLEHVKDDRTFLSELVANRLDVGGHVVITVPAFQALFSQHDRDLLHERRYKRSGIGEVARAAGLDVIDSGYIFASLIPPRALALARERWMPSRSRSSTPGVAGWRFGSAVTAPLTLTLWLDARSMLLAHDWGIDLPGLSCWLVCNRR